MNCEKHISDGDFYDKYVIDDLRVDGFSLKKQHNRVKDLVMDELSNLIDTSNFIGGYPVDRFETEFSKWLMDLRRDKPYSAPKIHVVGTSSGTSALEIALRCLDIGTGDEVLIPNNGWSANVSMVITTGAQPIFCDIDADTHNICLDSVKSKITNRTKAIIAIHMYGNVCDIQELKQFDIPVIEDCAQAVGAIYKGYSVGAWTEKQIGCFSFYPSKTLGAMGDAGALITTSEKYAVRAKAITDCGQYEKNSFDEFPMNARLDAFQACVLFIKLNFLGEYISRRKDIMEIYDESLSEQEFCQPKSFSRKGVSLYNYVIAPKDSGRYKQRLEDGNVGYSVRYPKPLHIHKFFSSYYKHSYYDYKRMPNDLENSIAFCNRVISLPFYPEMSDDEVNRVIEVLKG